MILIENAKKEKQIVAYNNSLAIFISSFSFLSRLLDIKVICATTHLVSISFFLNFSASAAVSLIYLINNFFSGLSEIAPNAILDAQLLFSFSAFSRFSVSSSTLSASRTSVYCSGVS